MIITVGPDRDGELSFRLLRGPVPPRDRVPRRFSPVRSNLPSGRPPPPPPGWVSLYGRELWQGLNTHPEVQRAFEDALRLNAGQPPRAILFELQDQRAELFNWEMLCDRDGNFLALDSRWPIGRIAEPGIDLAGGIPTFTAPLRLMAVLSALGVTATQEWTGLYQAVQLARGKGLAVQLHVLVGEANLLEQVSAAAETDPQLVVGEVRDSATDVQRAIKDAAPHLLHFFCHGSAEQGQPRLLLATPQDFEQARRRNDVSASVTLLLGDLQNFLASLGVWLVVLNCCEGGMAVEEVHSLAHSLVASGVPAALGMREAVQVLAANEFSRVLYGELLADLRERLQPVAGMPDDIELDWTKVLHSPRRALVERYNRDATTYGEWTLPVLYTRMEPFKIRVVAPPDGDTAGGPSPDDGPDVTPPPGSPPAPPLESGSGPPQPAEGPGPTAEGLGPTEEQVTAAILQALLQRLPPDAPPGMLAELRSLIPSQDDATDPPGAAGPGSEPPSPPEAG